MRNVYQHSTDRAWRTCLRCRKRFDSSGRGHRICPTCTKRAGKFSKLAEGAPVHAAIPFQEDEDENGD